MVRCQERAPLGCRHLQSHDRRERMYLAPPASRAALFLIAITGLELTHLRRIALTKIPYLRTTRDRPRFFTASSIVARTEGASGEESIGAGDEVRSTWIADQDAGQP